MKLLIVLGLLLFGMPHLAGETLTVEGYRLTLDKGFKVLLSREGEPIQIQTPSSLPVLAAALVKNKEITWEASALDFFLQNSSREGQKIVSTDTPEEVQIKREGPWTTIYWSYGGTKAYFGMYWGGRGIEESIVLFWANPLKAHGRAQYQALSEVTKGIKVEPL